MRFKIHYLLLLVFILNAAFFTDERFTVIETKLTELSKDVPGLSEKVDFSVNGASIQDLIRGIASTHSLNVSVDPSLNYKVVYTFTNVTVSDVFIFLCKKYDLDIAFVGTIMSFGQYVAPIPQTPKYISKQVKLGYDSYSNNLSFDFTNDSLSLVVREITKTTKKNVVYAPELAGKMVSCFIQAMPFDNAMDKFAFVNDMKVTLTSDNFYILEKKEILATNQTKNNGKTVFTNNNSANNFTLKLNGELLTIEAANASIADIVYAASNELKLDYFLFSDLKGNASLSIVNATYEEFLKFLLNGTDFTYKKTGTTYLFGDRNLEGLRSTKLVQLQYRTIDKVIDFIPADLKKGVDIKSFPDLNGLILSGSQPRIEEIEAFIKQIDRVVPVITIEVIIADISKTLAVSTGINVGLGDSPKKTGGTVFPNVDLTLSSTTINDLISGINGFGFINLGNVTPNFYMTLQAMETQGILKLRSTPQLSTLNGNEAKMSIGKTEYYLEISNNVIGAQNPQNIITQNYKSVTADLSLTINPIVSGDDQITLSITVKQSSFTERISPSAPPGTISRDFQSLVRVKNGEMIMLGGLEENSTNETSKGTPWLSRIPMFKWIFSSRNKTKKNSKITIFIKPSIIY